MSNDEQCNEIVKLLRTDPTLIAQFVTSPLSMDEQKIYAVSYTHLDVYKRQVEIQGYPFTVVGVVTEKDIYDLVRCV